MIHEGWTVTLTLDEQSALVRLVEQEGVADPDVESAYRKLQQTMTLAIQSEVKAAEASSRFRAPGCPSAS